MKTAYSLMIWKHRCRKELTLTLTQSIFTQRHIMESNPTSQENMLWSKPPGSLPGVTSSIWGLAMESFHSSALMALSHEFTSFCLRERLYPKAHIGIKPNTSRRIFTGQTMSSLACLGSSG
eukprot:8395277-Ditylum_brightwellii.AAC.1